MQTAREQIYSYEEYQQMYEQDALGNIKLEFIDGEIYAMSRGTPTHARMTARIIGLLTNQVQAPCEVYSPDLSIYIAAANVATHPDVSVVCGKPETKPGDPKALINPSLLVEVLSPTTERYDRGNKLGYYKLIPSLRAVVLVSQHRPEIMLIERMAGGPSSLTGTRDGWQVKLAHAGSTIMLEAPHVQLRVDDIYAGIELTPP
jgi:Uma2 family endonuclease